MVPFIGRHTGTGRTAMNDTHEGNAIRGIVAAGMMGGVFYCLVGIALVVLL
jgi:hypothetical protein